MNVILIGPPGSGKSTQAKLLADKLHLLRIASGDISRQLASEGTDDGRIVANIIAQGGLVPDDILFRRVRQIIDATPSDQGILMDGYPRNEDQIFLVEEMLKEKGWQVDKVVLINLSEEESTKRMLKRAQEENRADDTEAVIRERFRLYFERTQPIIDYYRQQGKVIDIDGRGTIEEVHSRILKYLEDTDT